MKRENGPQPDVGNDEWLRLENKRDVLLPDPAYEVCGIVHLEFSLTLETAMSSVATDAARMRVSEQEQEHLDLEDTPGQTERSQWVLNSPNPPPLWNKIFSPLKDTKFFFSFKKKTCHGHAVSFLESLFPILSWFRNYKASKFKDDLLAGLTLASLSIPQVFTTNITFIFSTMHEMWNIKFTFPSAFSLDSSIICIGCCRA